MRSVDFSEDNLHSQLYYLNRNLKRLGMAEGMDLFNQKAQNAIQHIIQGTVIKTQGYYQSVKSLDLWIFGIIQQLKEQRQAQPSKKATPSRILVTTDYESLQRS